MLRRGAETLVGFGVRSGAGYVNDIYRADISKKGNRQVATWTKIETKGTLPEERERMSVSV